MNFYALPLQRAEAGHSDGQTTWNLGQLAVDTDRSWQDPSKAG
jgi:hypothetical protein